MAPSSIVIEELLMGDVDLNGVVDSNDATLVLQSIGNPDRYQLTYRQMLAADVYEPGSGLTGKDSLEIQKYVNGQITHF